MHEITETAAWNTTPLSVPDDPDAINPFHVEAPVQELANRATYLRDRADLLTTRVTAVEDLVQTVDDFAHSLLPEHLRQGHTQELTRYTPVFISGFEFGYSDLIWIQSTVSAPSPTLVYPVPFPQLPVSHGDIIGRVDSITVKFRAATGHIALPENPFAVRFWRKRDGVNAVVGTDFSDPADLAEYEAPSGMTILFTSVGDLAETTSTDVFFVEILGERGDNSIPGAKLISVLTNWRPLP